MGRALYRKYRSKSLDEIVGQEHITDILRRAIKQNKVAHAYLLTGPRGVGKTSIARILAHEINSLPYTDESNHLDIIEIDAASNNGVEDVRDLREKVQIAPSSAKKKIYIIDEVHMLSKPAFNALLKTLEEPPEHIVFILATTDVDKLPATIISRVQRFTFRSISHEVAIKQLRFIADSEKISIDDEALANIAKHSEGSLRDSTSLLDQMSSLVEKDETITSKMIEATLGLSSSETIKNILAAHDENDVKRLAALLDNAERSGVSAGILARQIIAHIRSNISSKPQYMMLLDDLMDVSRSSFPYVKLLTALASGINTVEPQKTIVKSQTSAPNTQTAATKVKTVQHPIDPPKPKKMSEETVDKKPQETTPAKEKKTSLTTEIDWPKIIDSARQTGAGIGTLDLLKKCVPVYENGVLKLYTGGNFYKTKLDKQMSDISGLLQKNGYEVEIQTIGTKPPAQDSQAAAIIAMMGGGEEIDAS